MSVNAIAIAFFFGGHALIATLRPPLGYRNTGVQNLAWFSLLLYVAAFTAGHAWMNRTLSLDEIDRLIIQDVPAVGPNDGTAEDFCLRLIVLAYMRRSICWLMPLAITAFSIGPLLLGGFHAPIVYWIEFSTACVTVGLIYGEGPEADPVNEIFANSILPALRELKAEP